MKIITIALVALAIGGASLAAAAEVTREDYKSAVEPICETNTKATEKALKNVKAEIKGDKLKLAGSQVAKSGAALSQAYTKLKAVPQPQADSAKLTKWLSYLKEEVDLTKSVAAALNANNKNKAQSTIAKLTHVARLANNEVISFGFHYCKQDELKFS